MYKSLRFYNYVTDNYYSMQNLALSLNFKVNWTNYGIFKCHFHGVCKSFFFFKWHAYYYQFLSVIYVWYWRIEKQNVIVLNNKRNFVSILVFWYILPFEMETDRCFKYSRTIYYYNTFIFPFRNSHMLISAFMVKNRSDECIGNHDNKKDFFYFVWYKILPFEHV